MSQTIAIILRIDQARAPEFERLFEAENLPNLRKHHAEGGILSASLSRVELGTEADQAKAGGYVNYIAVAKVKDMAAHTAHDADPAFEAFNAKADAFQPTEPSVWGGTTLVEV